MKIKYDPEADAVYIYFREVPHAYTRELDELRRIDYASDDEPIGVELLCVSRGVDPDDLPEQEAIIQLLEREHIKVYA
jgi:uncharacterized protein YuzE